MAKDRESVDDEMGVAPPAAGGNRLLWSALPGYLQREITFLAGANVMSATSQAGGFSPGLASRLLLDNAQRQFVKAISAEQNQDGPGILRREARVSGSLPHSAPAPRLLWTYDDGTWVALGFEDIDGRQPVQPWDLADLDRVLDALVGMAVLMTPSPIDVVTIAESNAAAFRTWRQWSRNRPDIDLARIDPWIFPALGQLAELESQWESAATGETLLHGDLRADNILLTKDGVKFVDWPGAQVGAAWVDPLLMLPSAAMHGTDVQAVVENHPIFGGVDADKIDAVLAGVAGYFIGRSVEPPPPGLPAIRAFQAAQGRAALRWMWQRVL